MRVTGLLSGYAILLGIVRHNRTNPKAYKIRHRHHMINWGRGCLPCCSVAWYWARSSEVSGYSATSSSTVTPNITKGKSIQMQACKGDDMINFKYAEIKVLYILLGKLN